jgi:hypothetical protein
MQVAKCGGDVDQVLVLDADGSVRVDELLTVPTWKLLYANIFGSRFLPKSHVERPVTRGIVSVVFRFVARSAVRFALWRWRIGVDDTQCPFKFVQLIDVDFDTPFVSKRFAGDLEFILHIRGLCTSVPVSFIHVSGSKIRARTAVHMFFESMKIAIRFRKLYFSEQQDLIKESRRQREGGTHV